MTGRLSESVQTLAVILFLGGFLVLATETTALDAMADDSTVAEASAVDEAVAQDSQPQARPKATLRVHIDVVNDNGGTATPTDLDVFVNSSGFLTDGDVAWLRPGERTITEWNRIGYDVTAMSCVRTADGHVIAERFSTVDVQGHPFGQLPVQLNNGADITCTFTFDDQQVGFHVTPVAADGTAIEDLVTLVGDQALVGEDSAVVDSGTYDFASGTSGYTIDRMVCTQHHQWAQPNLEYIDTVDIILNGFDTGCLAYFEKLPDAPNGVTCTRSGSLVSWTAPDRVRVFVRSSAQGWQGSYTGSGSHDADGVEGDLFVRIWVKGAKVDTACEL